MKIGLITLRNNEGFGVFLFQDERRKVSLLNLMKYGGISKDSFVGGRLVSFFNNRKEEIRYWYGLSFRRQVRKVPQ